MPFCNLVISKAYQVDLEISLVLMIIQVVLWMIQQATKSLMLLTKIKKQSSVHLMFQILISRIDVLFIKTNKLKIYVKFSLKILLILLSLFLLWTSISLHLLLFYQYLAAHLRHLRQIQLR